jgi:uncharacterized protein with HEPN domain
MPRDDRARVRDALRAARQSVSLGQARSRGDLDSDVTLLLAPIRLQEVIGEAASGVSQEYRLAHDDIPWRKLIALRNRLIRDYWSVDPDVVWRTALDDLPPLTAQLEAALAPSEVPPSPPAEPPPEP